MISAVNHITFATSDIKKAIAFYVDVLEFKLIAQWQTGVYLMSDSVWLCIIQDSTTKNSPLKEYTHIAFTVDPEKFFVISTNVNSLQLKIWKENTSEGDSLYLLDPDFNKIELHCGHLYSRVASLLTKPYEDMKLFFDSAAIIQTERINICRPNIGDMSQFLSKAKSNNMRWVSPPNTEHSFVEYIRHINRDNQQGFFLKLKDTDELIGVINLNEIVYGSLQSAYLGYYLFEPYQKNGYMRESLKAVVQYTFKTLKLHRLEANIQSKNFDSINLVTSLGFTHEGFSRNYLKVNGQWCDHERFAIINND